MNADIIILNFAFGDNEHEFYPKHKRWDRGLGIDQHFNLVTNRKDTQGAFFDFDQAFHFQPNNSISAVKYIKHKLEDNLELAKQLQTKVQKFLTSTFENQDFFDAVLKKTQVDLSSKDFVRYFYSKGIKNNDQKLLADTLFNDITARLKFLEKVSADYILKHTK